MKRMIVTMIMTLQTVFMLMNMGCKRQAPDEEENTARDPNKQMARKHQASTVKKETGMATFDCEFVIKDVQTKIDVLKDVIEKQTLSGNIEPSYYKDKSQLEMFDDYLVLLKQYQETQVLGVTQTSKPEEEREVHEEYGVTHLMFAAGLGYLGVVKDLLAMGVNVDEKSDRDTTALMFAAGFGHTDIVKVLLSAGTDIHAKDDDGQTALVIAANAGQVTTVKQLLSAGANVNPENPDDEAALMAAAWRGHGDVIKELLSAGANVNVKNSFGNTALMAAVWSEDVGSIKKLLSAGTDVNAKDHRGKTALSVARTPEIKDLLLKAGAKEL